LSYGKISLSYGENSWIFGKFSSKTWFLGSIKQFFSRKLELWKKRSWVIAKYPWVTANFGLETLQKNPWLFRKHGKKTPGIDPVSEWCHKNNLIVKVCILAKRIIFLGRHVHLNREQGLYSNLFVRLSYCISRMTDRWNSFPIGPIICKCDATEYPLWLIFASMNWTFH